jgi:tRNA A-37 threonylcarbamoyl transferase component Bud32
MGMEEFYGSDKLFTLKDASDPSIMLPILWESLRHRFAADADLAHLDIEMLRRRKQRSVLRYRLQWNANGARQDMSLIAKVFKADHGEPVARFMDDLWRHGFDRNTADQIPIPEVIAYLPEKSLLIQEEIGGRAVKEYLNTPNDERAIRQMARGLAKLHRSPVRVGPEYHMEDHLRRCHPRPSLLRERCPKLQPAIDELLSEFHRLDAAWRHHPKTLIHGDFHMGQVHVDATHTWLIDFDAVAVADPAADLGNIVVFLKGKKRKVPNALQLVDAFLDEYFKEMPSEIHQRIALFEAVTLLRRACKRLRFQKDGWENRAGRFIEASLDSLNTVGRS